MSFFKRSGFFKAMASLSLTLSIIIIINTETLAYYEKRKVRNILMGRNLKSDMTD